MRSSKRRSLWIKRERLHTLREGLERLAGPEHGFARALRDETSLAPEERGQWESRDGMLVSPVCLSQGIILNGAGMRPNNQFLVCCSPGQAARSIGQDGPQARGSARDLPHIDQPVLGKQSKRTPGGAPGCIDQR